jgi:hypothetical protein
LRRPSQLEGRIQQKAEVHGDKMGKEERAEKAKKYLDEKCGKEDGEARGIIVHRL